MRPVTKPERTAEQCAEELAIRQRHAASPVRARPAGTLKRKSFVALVASLAQFKSEREKQGLTLDEVATRMGIDSPALSRLETGKTLNPTVATLVKWADALGRELHMELSTPS